MSCVPGTIYFSDSDSSSLSTSFAGAPTAGAGTDAHTTRLLPFRDGGLGLLRAAPLAGLLPADVTACWRQLEEGRAPRTDRTAALLTEEGASWRLVTVLRTDVVGDGAYCWVADSATEAEAFAAQRPTANAAQLLAQLCTAGPLWLVPRARLLHLPATLRRGRLQTVPFLSALPVADEVVAEGLLCSTLRLRQEAGHRLCGLLSVHVAASPREALLLLARPVGGAEVVECASLRHVRQLLGQQDDGDAAPATGERALVVFTGDTAVPQLFSFLREVCGTAMGFGALVKDAAEVLQRLLPSHAPLPLSVSWTRGRNSNGALQDSFFVDGAVAEDGFWQLLAAPRGTLAAPVLTLMSECCAFHDQSIPHILQDMVLPLQAQHTGLREWASALVRVGVPAADVTRTVRLCAGIFFFARVGQVALSDDGDVLLAEAVQPYWDLAVFFWCTSDTTLDDRPAFEDARRRFADLVAAALQPCGTISFERFQQHLLAYLYACLLCSIVQHMNSALHRPLDAAGERREVHLCALPTASLASGGQQQHRTASQAFAEWRLVLLEDLWAEALVESLAEEARREGVPCAAAGAVAQESRAAHAKERAGRRQRLAQEVAAWARQLPRFRLCERLGTTFPNKAISLLAAMEPVKGEQGLGASALWERVRTILQLPSTRLVVVHTLPSSDPGIVSDKALIANLRQAGLWQPFLWAARSLCNVFSLEHFALLHLRSAIWCCVFGLSGAEESSASGAGGRRVSFAASQLPPTQQLLYRTAVSYYEHAHYRQLAQLAKESVPCCAEMQMGVGSVFLSAALLEQLRSDASALKEEAAAYLRRIARGLSARLALAKRKQEKQALQLPAGTRALLPTSTLRLREDEAEREELLRGTSAARAEGLAARSRRVGSNGLTLQKEWAATVTLLHQELRAALQEMRHYEDDRARAEQRKVETVREQLLCFEEAMAPSAGDGGGAAHPPFGSGRGSRGDLWASSVVDAEAEKANREGHRTALKRLQLANSAARVRSARDSRLLQVAEGRQLQRHVGAQRRKWQPSRSSELSRTATAATIAGAQRQWPPQSTREGGEGHLDGADGLVHSHALPSFPTDSVNSGRESSWAAPLPWQTKQDLQSLWEMSNMT